MIDFEKLQVEKVKYCEEDNTIYCLLKPKPLKYITVNFILNKEDDVV